MIRRPEPDEIIAMSTGGCTRFFLKRRPRKQDDVRRTKTGRGTRKRLRDILEMRNSSSPGSRARLAFDFWRCGDQIFNEMEAFSLKCRTSLPFEFDANSLAFFSTA